MLGLIFLCKTRRFLVAAVISAIGGLATLGIINLTGIMTGITLPLSLFSVFVSVILGAPGVIGLLLTQMFW